MFHVPARPLSGLHPFDAHLPGMVACSGYHRLTLPRRDTVMVATRVPRRNTTVVLDSPHARPIGSKTTTGFDTSRATPCRSGPGQRWRSPHESPRQRSIRNESAALTARLRVPCMTAALRATAIAVITSWAAVSTAIQSQSEEHTSELQSPDHLVCR